MLLNEVREKNVSVETRDEEDFEVIINKNAKIDQYQCFQQEEKQGKSKMTLKRILIKVVLLLFLTQSFFQQLYVLYFNLHIDLFIFTLIYIIPMKFAHDSLIKDEKKERSKPHFLLQFFSIITGIQTVVDYFNCKITISYCLGVYLTNFYQTVLLFFMSFSLSISNCHILCFSLITFNTFLICNVHYQSNTILFEDFLNEQSDVLLRNFFHCLSQICVVHFCIHQMSFLQILILLIIKGIQFGSFFWKCQSNCFTLTLFNVITEYKTVKQTIQMKDLRHFLIHDIESFSRYFNIQYYYLLLLRIVETSYIALLFNYNLIQSTKSFPLFVTLHLISFAIVFKQCYQQFKVDKSQLSEHIEITSQENYLNLIRDFHAYKNLKQIFIKCSLSQTQIFESLFYNFNNCSVFIEQEKDQNKTGHTYYQRYRKTMNQQVIEITNLTLQEFNEQLKTEAVVPTVSKIILNELNDVSISYNDMIGLFSKLITHASLMAISFKYNLLKTDQQQLQKRYECYNTSMKQILVHNITFSKLMTQHLYNNPRVIFYDLYE